MKKSILLILFLISPALLCADTVYLEDGSSITGEISDENSESIMIVEVINPAVTKFTRLPKSEIVRIRKGRAQETIKPQIEQVEEKIPEKVPEEKVIRPVEKVVGARERDEKIEAQMREMGEVITRKIVEPLKAMVEDIWKPEVVQEVPEKKVIKPAEKIVEEKEKAVEEKPVERIAKRKVKKAPALKYKLVMRKDKKAMGPVKMKRP